jgi:formylglycine-generating enzyme required for sulfatase activity
MVMVYVPGGTFQMGNDTNADDDESLNTLSFLIAFG